MTEAHRRWVRLFEKTLAIYPEAFRRRYGKAMVTLFQDRLRAQSHPLATHLYAVRACGDAIRNGLLEAFEAGASRRLVRDRKPGGPMESLLSDLTLSLRQLRKRPLFATLAVVTLALGIGANAAIFSIVDAVLLRPLPFPESSRLYLPWASNPELARQVGFPDRLPHSAADFYDLVEQCDGFEALALFTPGRFNLTGDGDPERIAGVRVTGAFFDVFQRAPLLGRALHGEDDVAGRDRVAVLGYAFWQRRFGGEPDVVGRTIRLDGSETTVVGVMPEDFVFPRGSDLPSGFGFGATADLWVPLALGEEARSNRSTRGFAAVGRARSEVPRARLQSELDILAARLAREYPDSNQGWGFRLVPLREQIVGSVRASLWILLGAVGLVLLIACANVANLVLAKALERQREVQVKVALGASQSRLLRELLTESLLVTGIAALVGVVLAQWILSLVPYVPVELPYMGTVGLRGSVLFFTSGVSLGAALFFGLLPYWVLDRRTGNEGLSAGLGSRGSVPGRRMRAGLVVAEVALASMLLVGAGLLIRSFASIVAVDPGFDPEGALTFEVQLPQSEYGPSEQTRFFRELDERLSALPGARAVGAVTALPMSGSENLSPFLLEGQPPPDPSETVLADTRSATPGYFRAMGVPLLEGRLFRDTDDREAPPVAVVDETMARLAWPDGSALGKRLIAGTSFDEDDRWVTVVGVVGHVHNSGLHLDARPQIYWPHAQSESPLMGVVVRASAAPIDLAGPVRAVVRDLDPNEPVARLETLEDVVARSVAHRRFSMILLGAFAALALVLSAVGIYGVTAYAVGQRTRELGLRMALGGRPKDVLALVLWQSMGSVLLGMSLGLAGAMGLARLLSSLLFRVTPLDPATFGGAFAALLIVALVATLVPGFQATRVPPTAALRWE